MEMNAQIEAYEKEKIGYESTLDILRQKFTDFEEKMVRVIEENERLKTQINELETEQGFLRANQRYVYIRELRVIKIVRRKMHKI